MNQPARGESASASAVKRFGRALAWPIRRVLDPRFGGLAEQIEVTHDDAVRRSELALSHLTQHGLQNQEQLDMVRQLERALGRLSDDLGRLSDDLERVREVVLHQGEAQMETNAIFGRSLADLLAANELGPPAAASEYARRATEGTVTDVDEDVARLLNYAESHRGFAAQRSLWFNPPISLTYKSGEIEVASANERIAEVPYVFRALASLPRGSRILDVGAAESTLAFSLASLGFKTTALDLRAYPLSHPQLEVVVGRIEEWDSEPGSFDAIVCVSTIEHVGLGAYGGEVGASADFAAMKRMHELVVPEGILVLTVPAGRAATGERERTYDRKALEALLEGWNVEDLTVVRQEDPTTWRAVENGEAWEHDGEARHVALVTARRKP
jgi:2-polyprenyl-3-methyl-5-hydroxy-6-metoxy-1,4-benzoquinol methylase